MESRSWLVRRALLAIGLMIGFYLLAIAIAAVLLWIPYAEWTYAGRLHLKLLLGTVISALTVLWAIVPRIDRFTAPGPQLERTAAPKLFALIDDVAAKTRQAPPSEVYLVPEVNAWVAQRGGIMGLGSRRVMGIGMPLLQALSQHEIKAVIGHEFGHYAAGDVGLGPWIYKTRAAIGRTLQGVQDSLIEKPFEWYGRMFLKLTHSVSRQQEFIADRIGAEVAGVSSMASALRQLNPIGLAFMKYHFGEVMPVVSAGFMPPVAAGFADYLRLTGTATAGDSDDSLAGQPADEFDTHPPLAERLAALAKLGAVDAPARSDDAPGSELLLDFEKQTSALFADTMGQLTGQPLKPIAWAAVAEQVYVPRFRNNAQTIAKWLGQFTADSLPTEKSALIKAGTQLLDREEQGADDDTRLSRAVHGLGIGLTALLIENGWRLDASLGQPITLHKADTRIEPFLTVTNLSEGTLDPMEWKAWCSRYGISGQTLGAREAGEGSAAL